MIGLLAALMVNAGPGQATCVPGTKVYDAPYVAIDNAWLESSQCVVFNSVTSITITSNAVPNGNTVVAYPGFRRGRFYTWLCAGTGFPVPVTGLGRFAMRMDFTGNAGGAWQADADIWGHPNVASITHHHGTFELVVSTRSAWKVAGKGDPVAHIGGIKYRWSSWMTCQREGAAKLRLLNSAQVRALPQRYVLGPDGERVLALCDPKVADWRIAVFWRVHSKDKTRTYPGQLSWFLIHQGLLPRTDVWSSVATGVELWSGGKGLTISGSDTWPAMPHLGPPQGGGGK